MNSEELLNLLDGDRDHSAVPTLSSTGFLTLSIFLGFIMTFGFLNNLIVLVLFCRFKKLRTPMNMLLLNISVSDMLVCVCGTTLSFASSLHGRWLLGRRGCMWYGFINSCFGIVSLISLVILSFDRYSTLTVYHKRRPDYLRPLLAVGGSWFYSLFWTLPPLLGWSSYGLEGAGTSCSVSWTERSPQSHAYIICLFIFCLGLPVLVMVYSYGRLLYTVRKIGKIRKTAAWRKENHLLFMIITAVVSYMLCWTPYSIVALMATFGPSGIVTPVGHVVPSLLAKSSTVINPIIYILLNKQFYRCFLMLFCCKAKSTTESQSIMASKTTMVQLKGIMQRDTEACTAQMCTELQTHSCSIIARKEIDPPEITT